MSTTASLINPEAGLIITVYSENTVLYLSLAVSVLKPPHIHAYIKTLSILLPQIYENFPTVGFLVRRSLWLSLFPNLHFRTSPKLLQNWLPLSHITHTSVMLSPTTSRTFQFSSPPPFIFIPSDPPSLDPGQPALHV